MGDVHTWCPECGPDTAIDEDGCCKACGATAEGPGADAAWAALEDERTQHRRALALLRDVTDEGALDGCGIDEAVAIVISQRDNARVAADHYLAERNALAKELAQRDEDARKELHALLQSIRGPNVSTFDCTQRLAETERALGEEAGNG